MTTSAQNGGAGAPNTRQLLIRLAQAEQKLELARKKAHLAKVAYKRSRKALKQAKKAAKRARKVAKAAIKPAKAKPARVRRERKPGGAPKGGSVRRKL
jgi:hypothetical protein